MTLRDKINEEFLLSLKEVEPLLLTLQFKPHSYLEKGAYYIGYKKESTGSIVEFLFGPPEWQIEMIILTSKGKFAFKDTFVIPVVAKWLNENRYKEENGRDMKNEMLYCIELLKVSLPTIE